MASAHCFHPYDRILHPARGGGAYHVGIAAPCDLVSQRDAVRPVRVNVHFKRHMRRGIRLRHEQRVFNRHERVGIRMHYECGRRMRAHMLFQREAPEVLELAERSIYDIAMRRGSEAFVAARDAVPTTYAMVQELLVNKGSINGIPTGFTDLDNLLTGLHPGEMILIAARPSMGKTTLGMNIAANAAIRGGKKVAVFSLEMPVEQLMLRMMCSEAQVNMQNLRHGVLTDDELERLGDTLLPLSNAEIYMDATSGITVTEMRSRCRRLQIEHGLDLVMIDYIGLMSAGSGNPNRSRQEEVAASSRAIKGLAQELRVPIITLSQLSRAPQGRANHRPVLSDLRDSGAIEQDADVVMFIHREGYYDPEYEDKTATEIIVAKQRNGPLDTVMVTFLGEYVKFVNSLNPNAPPPPPPPPGM